MKNISTGRMTGLFYLGLALAGIFSFLFVKEGFYVAGDAQATAANINDKESLVRFGLVGELDIVLFQSLAAIWFFKLFHKKSMSAASAITIFGMVNAILILISSAFWLQAIDLAVAGNATEALRAMEVHENIWVVASLFFGLWLIPMGIAARKHKFPTWLPRFLLIGGVGYMLSAVVKILLPDSSDLSEAITIPASIGEFWMIGYLLFKT